MIKHKKHKVRMVIYSEIVSLLTQAGANVNSKNDRNKTPLMRTANVDIAKLLVGADLNDVDHYQKNGINDYLRRLDLKKTSQYSSLSRELTYMLGTVRDGQL